MIENLAQAIRAAQASELPDQRNVPMSECSEADVAEYIIELMKADTDALRDETRAAFGSDDYEFLEFREANANAFLASIERAE